ncbi:MAG: transpeptidase family protein [Bacteroidia bacterium]|jgi:cell division protein FtsI (penicillin-binding protein 3)|nr:transpeptidase family protein [Bacteroidia bacterium]
MAANVRKVILIRTYTAFTLMCVFAAAIVYTLFKIQFIEKEKWVQMSEDLSTTIQTIEPVRGTIFANDGSVLATSLPIYDLRIDAKAPGFAKNDIFENNVDSLSLLLSQLFQDRSKGEYKRILTGIKRRKERYYLLKRKVTYPQMKAVKSFPIFRLGKYKGGLTIEEKNKREKPFGYLAERTIGYSVKGVAPVGLEGAYNTELSGKEGKRAMQRIAGGTWIPLNDEQQIEARNGNDIHTTIDVNLQDVATHALMRTLTQNDAAWGTAILMEVKTGEIRAIANLTKVSEGVYTENYNYAVGESLEPGSTFKLASALALLEDKYVKMTDQFDTENGEKKYFETAIMYDSERGGHGIVSFQQAFEISSNVAISKAIYQYYKSNPTKYYKHLERLHFTTTLGLQIKGEGKPRIKHPKDNDWYGTTLPWSSIGYEVKVTPMQVLTLYNAVANNGKMVKPFFVKKITQTGKLIKEYKTEVIEDKIAGEATIKNLRIMMEGVVERGTARSLKNPNYSVGGKTGTALVADGRKGYKEKIYRSSFCGYFPADNPQYTCMVMVNAPSKGIYYGGAVAGPVFKEIADKVYANSHNLHGDIKLILANNNELPIEIKNGFKTHVNTVLSKLGYNLKLDSDSIEESGSEWIQGIVNTKQSNIYTKNIPTKMVPDVSGMGIKNAIYLLENIGLKVQVNGAGKVKSQSIPAGTTIIKGATIKLILS